jgi:hypothetical protein
MEKELSEIQQLILKSLSAARDTVKERLPVAKTVSDVQFAARRSARMFAKELCGGKKDILSLTIVKLLNIMRDLIIINCKDVQSAGAVVDSACFEAVNVFVNGLQAAAV